MNKRASWMPQVRSFSQADPRVVQRPEGINSIGDNPVELRDTENGTLERYADVQVSPGGWWEGWFPTNATITVGGTTTLCDSPLGFPAHTVLVDNWTNQWLLIDGIRRYIPPYTGGWVINAVSGTQIARVELEVPSTAVTEIAALGGEYVWVGFAEASLQPSTGIGIGPTNPLQISTPITVSANSLVAGATTVTIPAIAGRTAYVTGFQVTGGGATGASVITITLAGVIGGTITYFLAIPAGAAVGVTPLEVVFTPPLAASGPGVAIVLTVPTFGAGNTNAATSIQGYYV
jgi:hypothetical protein